MQSIVSETNNLWGSSFCPKYWKFDVDFGNGVKSSKNTFRFLDNSISIVAVNTRFYWERILFIGCQCLNKQSQDFRYYKDRIFQAHFLSVWSINLTKILPCRFRQCLGAFNMLTVETFSDTGLFRPLSNPAFCSL